LLETVVGEFRNAGKKAPNMHGLGLWLSHLLNDGIRYVDGIEDLVASCGNLVDFFRFFAHYQIGPSGEWSSEQSIQSAWP
jgi:hypothetical protein